MRQIVYISTLHRDAVVDIDDLMAVSQRNNTRQHVTGLLFFDGKRFLQALEGEEAAVETTLARIRDDARHRAIVILSDRTVAAREFGPWAMAYRASGGDEGEIARIEALVANATPAVRATFEGFARMRRAA
ncbi:BLUF domain-containing protein [Sphingomonas mollis]|uniref:BLUF domain-containing protein n=1 Tax=Sphingomonas mollis TaxID=2795726 RepID=A0ABS0XL61_9SPHN|nr:BLUF domain-containing protein [Sphingomonas sp. BT553]MBJ6120769.1 BLUF domain-containing protein [Sphingomonas sp. BT553]